MKPELLKDTAKNIEMDAEVVSQLNLVLKDRLAGINQYFLHARMMKHLGYMKLADYEYKESIQQMKYSDMLVERVLHLGGLPNLQEIGALHIGNDVKSILECDREMLRNGMIIFQKAVETCKLFGDKSSIEILNDIHENKQKHIEFIEAQLNLIDMMGLSKYLQTQV